MQNTTTPGTAALESEAKRVMAESGVTVSYMFGTMIEVPRAALTAAEIAEVAQFFSFGTNDLTQMGFGFSRDDIGGFLPEYLKQDILEVDPFQSLDTSGVGQLVDIAVKKGRGVKPGIKLGICGEHGGDPQSVIFWDSIGLDYAREYWNQPQAAISSRAPSPVSTRRAGDRSPDRSWRPR